MNYAVLDPLIEDEKRIRTDVFITEQGFLHEFDEIDEYATHLLVYDGDKPIGCGRIYEVLNDSHVSGDSGSGSPAAEPPVYAIGRIALVKEYRGMQLGSAIVWKLTKLAEEYGAKTIQLSAQCRARGFYEKCGFTAVGETYMDEQYPHILMRKIV